MCVAYRLSLRVVWLFFPQCPSGPRSRVGCLFGTVRASASAMPIASAATAVRAPNPIEFIHIPKTGGQAIEAWGLHHGLAWGGCRLKAGGPSWPAHPGKFGTYTRGSFHIPPVAWEAAHTPPFAAGAPTFCVVRHPFTRAVSEYTWQAKWTPYWRTCTQHGQSACPCSAPARLLRLFRARLAAPGGSRHPRREARPLGAQLLP